MIKDLFNPLSLVVKARAPIMAPLMMLPYNTFATMSTDAIFMYRFTESFIIILQIHVLIFLQPFDTTLHVPYIFDVAAIMCTTAHA